MLRLSAASPTIETYSTGARSRVSPRGGTPVLHLINGDDYSGAERVQDLLAQRLPDFGYDVSFACLKPGRFDQARTARWVPLHAAPMANKVDFRPVMTVSRMIRAGKFAVLHTHSPRALLIGRPAAALARVPIVHHVQCPAMAGSTRALRNRVNAVVERVCLHGVDRAVAVSSSLGRYLRGMGVPDSRIAVVPNAVPIRGTLEPRAAPGPEWTIGICALFRPRKGIEVLLAALAKLRDQRLPVRLRAVGYFQEASYERRIRRMSAELELESVIDWRGFSHDVHEELAKMDLFVLPSLFGEGLPLAILEAMSAGVPVISTDVEGTPEAVRDGVDGVIVAPGDAEALAAGIGRVVRGELCWESLRHSAWRRQRDHYSDTKLAADVGRIYDELIASGRPSRAGGAS